MAARKFRTSWWVDFRFDHTRYRLRSPDNSRAGAQSYEAAIRQKLARGETVTQAVHTGAKKQTFEQFAAQWFREYVQTNNKYGEQRIKRYTLDSSLVPFFGKMLITEIKTVHMEQYKLRRMNDGLSNKTIKNHLTVLSKCLTCAYEWLEIPSRPPKVPWPKCSQPKTDYLSQAECKLLLRHAHGLTHDILLMALRTGMRQGELKGLQWDSIDWENKLLIVQHSRCDRKRGLGSTKSNRIRSIPLDHGLYEVLYRQERMSGYVFTDQEGKPLSHDKLSYRLTQLCKSAGLRRITWHVLRHTFATQLAMRGVPLHAVQTLLGHSTIAMTLRYAHVAPSALRAAIDLLNPRNFAELGGQPVGNAWVQAQQLSDLSSQMPLTRAM